MTDILGTALWLSLAVGIIATGSLLVSSQIDGGIQGASTNLATALTGAGL